MKCRLLSFVAIITLIASCTPAEQEKYFNYHHGGKNNEQADNEKAVLPLLDPQGINMDMMDSRLADIVNEANDIEFQIAVLIERLKKMRSEISGFALVKKVAVQSDINGDDGKGKTLNDIVENSLEPDAGTTQKTMPANEGSVVADESIMNLQGDIAEPEASVVKKPKPESTPQKPMPTGNGVVDVRIGVHNDKTRLVFDVNGSTKNTVNFDREAGLLTVTMPDTEWSAVKTKNYKLDQIKGFEAKTEGDGTIVALAVTNTSFVDTVSLAGNSNRPARLVIDLMK